MSERTWDENRETINDLWPLMELRSEERKLWHDDLSGLDQDTLYEALRDVKRSKESPWPQLAWIHESYRHLRAAMRTAERMAEQRQPAYSGERLVIDVEESNRHYTWYRDMLSGAQTIADLDGLLAEMSGKLDVLEARSAVKLFAAARASRERIEQASRDACPEAVA